MSGMESGEKKVLEAYTRVRGCEGLGSGDGQKSGESKEGFHGDDA